MARDQLCGLPGRQGEELLRIPAEALGKGRTVEESLLGSGDWLATFMDHGKQSATIHKVISPDGNTMTQTAKFVDAHGQTLTQIQVFRRQ